MKNIAFRKIMGIVAISLLLLSGENVCQGQTLPWSYTNTGISHTIHIQSNIVTLDGIPIVVGDVIGVFYDSSGNAACGGYYVWNSSFTTLTAWGSEVGVDNGFQVNEPFTWKLWQASTGLEFEMTAYYLPYSYQGNFAVNGQSGLASLFSNFPVTGSLTFDTVISAATCYTTCNGSIDLTVNGGIPPYFYQWSNGATSQDINNLCFGNYTITVFDSTSGPPPVFPWTCIQTNVNHTILIWNNCNINGLPLQNGDVIGVFYSNGPIMQCGGYHIYSNSETQFTIAAWGDDILTPAKDGFTEGEYFSWKVWKAIDNEVININVNCYVSPINQGYFSSYGMTGICGMSGSYTPPSNFNYLLIEAEVLSPPEITISAQISSYNTYGVSSIGANDGYIQLSVSGGVSPYSYLWTNGSTSNHLINLSAGNYSVTVTDANSCTKINNYLLTQAFNPNPIITETSCGNSCDGIIELDILGGVAPIYFKWNDTWTSVNPRTGLCQEEYSVRIWDISGYSKFKTFYITVGGPTAIEVSSTLSVYNGYGTSTISSNNGYIDLSISGANSPYSFQWSNSETTEDIDSLGAGFYSVTIIDADSCTMTDNFEISQPINVIDSISGPSCENLCNGSINLNIIGGIPPFSIIWSNGATSSNLSNICTGVYSVTITDTVGIAFSQSYTVTSLYEIVTSVQQSDFNGYGVSTTGASDGWIDLTVSGGISPYSYTWINGETTEDIDSLTSGYYTVSISDSLSCIATGGYVILSMELGSVQEVDMVSCYGSCNGSINVIPVGGAPPFHYNWTNGETTPALSELCPGQYTITVYDSTSFPPPTFPWSFSYTANNHIVLLQNSISLINGLPLQTGDYIGAFYLNGTTMECAGYQIWDGLPNGTAITIWGDDVTEPGKNGFNVGESFNWKVWRAPEGEVIDLSATYMSNFYYQGNYAINGISGIATFSGSYTPPANINYLLLDFEIEDPPPMLFSDSLSNYAGFGTSAIGASDGSINLTISGGTSPFTFIWSTGATTEDISNLPAGNYTITVTDANACTQSETFFISQPYLISSSSVDASCGNTCDGSISLSVDGAISPYGFSWSNGGSTQNVSGLCQGSYSVTVSDASVPAVDTVLNFNIAGPTAIAITALLSNYNGSGVSAPGANDGWIDVSVSGGMPPYTFAWSSGETTEDIQNIPAGNYTVTVMDANACSLTESFLIEQTLYISATIIDESCFGLCDGAIQINASGGIQPYIYSWSNGATLQNPTNLCGATYQLTVTDSIGTVSVDTFTVASPSEIFAPAQLSDYSGYGVSSSGAADGWIDLTVSGGSSPFSFAWSTGATTEDISNLPAGNYLLTISDANACQQTFSFSISPVPFNPALTITGITADASCFASCNGSIDITVLGGNPWYSYLWTDGATSEDRTNLCAGNYTVVVQDNAPTTSGQAFNWSYYVSSGNHTIAIPFGTVSVNGAAPDVGDVIGVFYDSTGVLKCGGYFTYNGGTIVVAAMQHDPIPGSGKNGFETGDAFHWKLWRASDSITVNMTATYSPTQANQGTFQPNGISATSSLIGSYTLQGSQQTQVASFTIAQPDSIALNAVVVNVDTINNLLGSISLNPGGGIPPYSFLWSTGDTLQDISLLDTGWYALALTDANLCEVEEGFYVGIQPLPQIIATSNINQVTCYGACNGYINLNVSSGVPPFSYQWSNGATMEPINGLCAGLYFVTIYDTYDSLILDFEITEPDILGITLTIIEVDPLDPFSGDLNIIPYGGIVPYTYTWSNGATTFEASGLSIGQYTVTIQDANGCSYEDDVTLNYSYMPDSLSINAISTNISCNGFCDGQIDVSISGGITPYSYIWASGDTIEDLNNLCPGNYELSVLDALNGYQLMPWDYIITSTSMTIRGSAQIDSSWNTIGDFFGVFYLDSSELKCGGYTNVMYGGFNVLAYGDDPATPNKDGFAQGDSIYYKLWRLSDGNIVDMDVLNFNPQYFQGTFNAGGYSWQTNYSGTYTPTPNYTTASFTILEPDPISVSGIMSDYGGFGVSVWGASDGSIDATVLGGTPPYTFLWTGGISTEDLANIPAGQYELILTDANGCDTAEIFELTSPPPPPIVANGTIQNATCFGTCDGAIEVTATGGIPPLNFAWSNGETTLMVDNLCVGLYQLTVSDVDSSLVVSFEITEPIEIQLSFTSGNVDPVSGLGGMISASVIGGVTPYTYLWSNGETIPNISSISYGLHTLTVTDFNGCQKTGSEFVDFMFFPAWPVIETQNQHTIEIPASADLLLNGVALSTNDFLGVFYDSSGTQKCGGYAVWQNQAVNLVAYGNDAGTTNQDGFLTGDEFSWKIWDASEDLVHDAFAVYLTGYPNQQHFVVSGSSGIDSIYTNSLSGTVSTTTKANLQLGMVVVYEQNATGYYAIKKGLVVNGNYKIDGLKTGNYICYAIPQPGHDWGIPGYYPTQNDWQAANWVHVQANTTGINITIDPVLPYTTGTASISGNIMVGDDASYNPAVFDNEWFPPSTKNNGNPARNIPILLYDSLQHPIDFRLTDALGLFAYDNLEYGTYFVKVEKAGLQSEPIEVVLDASNPTSDNLTFQLNEGQVIGIQSINSKYNILLYPNPANEKLNVVLPFDYGKIQSLEIFSQLGTKQKSSFSSSKENILQVDLAGFAAGIYLLKLSSGKNVVVAKFIKE